MQRKKMIKENERRKTNGGVEQEQRIFNSKKKDSSAKIIFGDPVLCAQFLNGYVDIPMLKKVRAEDIEDVSNRYVHMFVEERNSDIVKCIHVWDEKGEKCHFISYPLLNIRIKQTIM